MLPFCLYNHFSKFSELIVSAQDCRIKELNILIRKNIKINRARRRVNNAVCCSSGSVEKTFKTVKRLI